MTRDEIEHEESTNKAILTQGPLVFKEKQQSGGKLREKAFLLRCVYVKEVLDVPVFRCLFLKMYIIYVAQTLKHYLNSGQFYWYTINAVV